MKIGSRVMLIFNIDVTDLLCNGAMGTIIGIEENQNEEVYGVIVKFVSCDIAITYAASAQSLCLFVVVVVL